MPAGARPLGLGPRRQCGPRQLRALEVPPRPVSWPQLQVRGRSRPQRPPWLLGTPAGAAALRGSSLSPLRADDSAPLKGGTALPFRTPSCLSCRRSPPLTRTSRGSCCHCRQGVGRARTAGCISGSPRLLAGNSALAGVEADRPGGHQDTRQRGPPVPAGDFQGAGARCVEVTAPARTCSELRSRALGQGPGAPWASSARASPA